ncbi:MAG: flavodoxin family protein [Balneolaceae bacterium]|nr:MAG: flavodoxin family protein [Balneolaceae bacterium]
MVRLFITFSFLLISCASNAQPTILVVYHSESGNTAALAEAVADGARSVDGVAVILKTSDEATEADLVNADAIIVGSPVYNANVTPEISRFIASWPFEGEPLKNKLGAAFVTAGGISAGEELVQMNILQSMLIFGMIVVGGPDWTQAFGASAITGEAPFNIESPQEMDEKFLERGRNLGQRVAGIALDLQDR